MARHRPLRLRHATLLIAAAACGAPPAWPQAASGAAPAHPGDACAAIDDALARLACYDRAHRRGATPQAAPGDVVATPSAPATVPAATAATHPATTAAPASRDAVEARAEAKATPAAAAGIGGSGLSELWELDDEFDQGTFRMVPHRANYLLPVRYTTSPNRRPASPKPDHTVTEDLPVRSIESKFQFSFKFKAISSLFGPGSDVWLGYTQQSHWQVYNDAFSSPFRETNYEPEVMWLLRTDRDVWGWRWRVLNLGLSHQSNGRGLPLSRSWNRVYAQFGLERGPYTLLLRPWLRFAEKDETDDNPDARQYYGSADLRLTWIGAGHVLSAYGRYSLSGRRGAVQFDWAFPIRGALKGYLQATSGYGESMIDYNHRQNTLGIGVLLLPWL